MPAPNANHCRHRLWVSQSMPLDILALTWCTAFLRNGHMIGREFASSSNGLRLLELQVKCLSGPTVLPTQLQYNLLSSYRFSQHVQDLRTSIESWFAACLAQLTSFGQSGRSYIPIRIMNSLSPVYNYSKISHNSVVIASTRTLPTTESPKPLEPP